MAGSTCARSVAAATAALTSLSLMLPRAQDDDDVRWQEPTGAGTSDEAPLSAEQIASWRERGFAAVDGLFPQELIDDARREMHETPPGRLGRGLMLPSLPSLDAISTHPRLRAAARQLLGTDRLTLMQSEAWAKSPTTFAGGPYDNRDQRVRRSTAPKPCEP